MPWWGWVIVGGILLGAELVFDSEFYLVFLGFAAILTGLLGVTGWTGPIALQWAIFGALAFVLLVGFRRRLHAKAKGQAPGHRALIGEIAIALEKIEVGEIGPAELFGSRWSGRNVGEQALDIGRRARVEGVDGLVLRIRQED